MEGNPGAPHRDSLNAFLPNYVIPLTAFRDGQLIVEHESGSVPLSQDISGPKGVLLPVAEGPVSFCARTCLHVARPAKGRRVVLVAFSLALAHSMSDPDRSTLSALGFPLPDDQALLGCVAPQPSVLALPPPARSLLPRAGAEPGEGCNSLPPQGPSLAAAPSSGQTPLLLEVCAGSAVLSKCAASSGWTVLPVDHAGCRFVPELPLLFLDLRNEDCARILDGAVPPGTKCWLHLGLPCGTCSRARERALPTGNGPRPLRDPDNLLGLPGLRTDEVERVASANAIYASGVAILRLAFRRQWLVSLENPLRSWLWPLLASLVKASRDSAFVRWYFALADVDFDMCEHGGPRDKATRLKSSPGVFSSMAVACSKTHQHAPWTPARLEEGWCFPTKDEARYPVLLCERLLACALPALKACPCPEILREQRALLRAQAGSQTRHLPQLVPEYAFRCAASAVPAGRDFKILKPSCLHRGNKPEASSSEDSQPPARSSCKPPGMNDPPTALPETAGVYHTMEEHLDYALKVTPPCDTANALPDSLRWNVFRHLILGPCAIAKERLSQYQSLKAAAARCEVQEAQLRKDMNPDVEAVTRGKALALFRELLEETHFPDAEVMSIMLKGVPLVGPEPDSPLFDKRPRHATLSEAQLLAQAQARRTVTMSSRSCVEPRDVKVLEDETQKELEAGYLQGPYHTEEEVTQALGTPFWSLNPRFALNQGEDQKVRVIDDFKASAVNQAFSSSSYLDLHDVDFTTALLKLLAAQTSRNGPVEILLSDGTVLRGELHPEYRSKPALLGRTVDLSKAYKQVAIEPSSAKHAVLGYPTAPGKWKYLISKSLPFGAGASVFSFNKVARALWHILVVKFGALLSNFYDDYTFLEFQPGASLMSKVLETLLTLLGWVFAKEGKKHVPFAQTVVSLGVRFDLTRFWEGSFEVGNKPGRLKRILEMLQPIADGKPATRVQLASLHGHLNFAGGYVLGFALKPAAQLLSRNLYGPNGGQGPELADAARAAIAAIRSSRPRICRAPSGRNLVLYTDGAFENGIGTWGALVCDPCSGRRMLFSGQVPRPLIQHWLRSAGSQVICQVEAYALMATLYGLRGSVNDRLILAFIDNEACRYGLIKRASPAVSMARLMAIISLVETSIGCSLWIERVPSSSNPADLPSRLRAAEAAQRFAALDKGDVPVTASMMDLILADHYDPDTAVAIASAIQFEADAVSVTTTGAMQ